MTDFNIYADNILSTAEYVHAETGVDYPSALPDFKAFESYVLECKRSVLSSAAKYRMLVAAVAPMIFAARTLLGYERLDLGQDGLACFREPNAEYRLASPRAKSQAAAREGAGANLAAQVEQARVHTTPPNDHGDVVRFMYNANRLRLTPFAAMWLSDAGRWFLTGEGKILPKSMTHEEFVALLAKPVVSEAQAASEWRDI